MSTAPVLPPELKASIDAAATAVPADKKGALVFSVAQAGREPVAAQAAVAWKPNAHVTLGAAAAWRGKTAWGLNGQVTW